VRLRAEAVGMKRLRAAIVVLFLSASCAMAGKPLEKGLELWDKGERAEAVVWFEKSLDVNKDRRRSLYYLCMARAGLTPGPLEDLDLAVRYCSEAAESEASPQAKSFAYTLLAYALSKLYDREVRKLVIEGVALKEKAREVFEAADWKRLERLSRDAMRNMKIGRELLVDPELKKTMGRLHDKTAGIVATADHMVAKLREFLYEGSDSGETKELKTQGIP